MKQTAVEWLVMQIEKDSDVIFYERNLHPFDECVKQAKEMEKEQIMKARQDIFHTGNLTAEQYYNETFKSE